ncbi:hypothetical protein HGRIS_003106 [Hohenbuehelia grisea]|uniref:Uncharacterized protein n=1 Tax=Hohenbuehelia grisea TaxID=104357 RepID=A0ABR3JN83_9AGAR
MPSKPPDPTSLPRSTSSVALAILQILIPIFYGLNVGLIGRYLLSPHFRGDKLLIKILVCALSFLCTTQLLFISQGVYSHFLDTTARLGSGSMFNDVALYGSVGRLHVRMIEDPYVVICFAASFNGLFDSNLCIRTRSILVLAFFGSRCPKLLLE